MSELATEGREAGRVWAVHKATAVELELLAIHTIKSTSGEQPFVTTGAGGCSGAELFPGRGQRPLCLGSRLLAS